MSAQAGVFYFDGRPVDAELPYRLGAALEDFGPDGGGTHVGNGLAMAYRALHVTPEDPRERQPFISRRGNVMTWDGRLDNREDLLLQVWREIEDDTTDVAVATAAYEKWGDEGFARLIGDWSLVVYNVGARELVMASDYMGIRGLYYSANEVSVAWSSSLGVLVEFVGCFGDVDPAFAFGYLTSAIPPGATPYRCIRSVPPRHSLTWSSSSPTQREYWQFSPSVARRRCVTEYADELREVFTQSVRSRLRSTRAVWAELSGGLER